MKENKARTSHLAANSKFLDVSSENVKIEHGYKISEKVTPKAPRKDPQLASVCDFRDRKPIGHIKTSSSYMDTSMSETIDPSSSSQANRLNSHHEKFKSFLNDFTQKLQLCKAKPIRNSKKKLEYSIVYQSNKPTPAYSSTERVDLKEINSNLYNKHKISVG